MENPEAKLGRSLPNATEVKGIDQNRDAFEPIFDFELKTAKDFGRDYIPERPLVGEVKNDNLESLNAA